MKHKVGIIGAGIAGICMCKQLLDKEIDDIKIFEQRSDIGGIWDYDPNPNAENALYESLTTSDGGPGLRALGWASAGRLRAGQPGHIEAMA